MKLPIPSEAFRKDFAESVINTLGRIVTFRVSAGLIDCPTCNGTDPYCPTCNGNKKIHSTTEYNETVIVRWKPSENKIYKPDGQYVDGDCTIIVKNDSDFTVSGASEWLPNVINVLVDGKTCVVDRWYAKGTPTNRYYVILYEDIPDKQRAS